MTTQNYQKVWRDALDNLEQQMLRGTFDSWLRGTRAIAVDDTDCITVEVKNKYAAEWLECRLNTAIERTVRRITGNGTTLRYVVAQAEADSAPQVAETTAAETDPAATPPPAESPRLVEAAARPERVETVESTADEESWTPPADAPAGFAQVSNYALRFWAPLLGRTAWRVWELCRERDRRRKKTDWTPTRRWRLSDLAAAVPCSTAALTGVERRCAVTDDGAYHVDAVAAFLEALREVTRKGNLAHVAMGDILSNIRAQYGALPFPAPHLRKIEEAARAEDHTALRDLVSAGLYRRHQNGAFDVLQREGIAEVTAYGTERRSAYGVSVRTELSWLHPSQVAQLSSAMQAEHDEWVSAHGLDADDWKC